MSFKIMPNASNAIEWLEQEVAPVRHLVAAVAAGRSVAQALDKAQAPEFVRGFVETTFSYCLDRHIQLDEDTHAPLAHQMVRELCADDPTRWQECQ